MAATKTETQPYNVINDEDQFEIRYYPTATLAKISSTTKSYRNLGFSGFGKLAKYIFGGNSEKQQIPMTSPVHMDIGETLSTISFVMPSYLNKDNLPQPNSAAVEIHTTEPEYVAALQFGGFGTTSKINRQRAKLEALLKEKGISFYGNFRYLGYNPPYQLFGRRNEVIVSIHYTETD